MLALHRHVADLIWRAGRVHVDAALAKERFAAFLLLRQIVRDSLNPPLCVVDPGDQLTGVDCHARDFDHFIAVQI